MATSGKKNKKSKEKKLSLQDFLAKSAPQTAGGTTQVAVQKYSSWAEECEEDDDRKIEIIQLPTAPRAARILEDNSIPTDPPFYARVSNLPFDINETDVDDFFSDHNVQIKEMKLARDDTNDRLRGFGHIEFETREDLMDAIMLTDPTIRGRRIRIEFTIEPDTNSGRTVRKRYENYTPRDSANESTNWRDRKESNLETVGGENRENRRNFQSRSNFQNRHDTNNNDNNDSNWRLGDRPNDSPPPSERRQRFGNDRRNDRDRDRGRFDRREQKEMLPEERPKLNIAPRTLPLPELNFPTEEELERETKKIAINGDKENHNDSGLPDEEEKHKETILKQKSIPKENIFGLAKPVDTAARDREIEEKLEQERQEKVKQEKDKREVQSSVSQEEVPKKDVIVIRTESSKRQDETNWRKRDETSTNGSSAEIKHRSGNRTLGRNDDRPRQFNKDNRDNRSFTNRGNDRDYRGNGVMQRDRRDNNIRRGGDLGTTRRVDEREIRRDEREPRRDKNHDMPKYVESKGPNLQTSNLFAGLDDEVDAE